MHNYGRAIWVTAYREFLRYVNNRSRLASSFLMPILLLIIFGAGFNKSLGNLVPGVDFIKYMYPGIIAMSVFQTSLFAGLSIVWDREIGFLREVLVAPLPRSGIILGKAVGNAVTAIIQGMVMLIIGPFCPCQPKPSDCSGTYTNLDHHLDGNFGNRAIGWFAPPLPAEFPDGDRGSNAASHVRFRCFFPIE